MKIQKLGIEWGPAFEEAQPIRISHYGREIVVFVNSNHDLTVEMPPGTTVALGDTKIFTGTSQPCLTALIKG